MEEPRAPVMGGAVRSAVRIPTRSGPRAWLHGERLLGPLLLAPAALYIVLLVGAPLLFAIYLAFSNATTGSQTFEFVGPANFIRAMQNTIFRSALANTFIFTIIAQVLVIVFGNILALTLQQRFPGRGLVRFLILLPWATPISLAAIAWKWMFDSLYSVVNWMLRAVNILGPTDFPQWLGVPHLAMAAVIMVHVWRTFPFSAVVILAGLTSIPQEVMDAAAVDGAGFFQRLFHILLPMLKPILIIAVLFGTVFTFTDMGVVYILTSGGPFNTTHVLSSWAFQVGIIAGDLAQGAAVALFLLPVLLAGAITMLRVAARAETGV
ncbi:MAG: sugar ABC transporter permease [Armatimonadota bacterium]|nr:sugar ABC transporter permease [Armatimonadota bacterium]MDR7485967.1 sugar ABC transporter permease [Armatimonadota bacterium]MDR7537309.1 sugar ABC transporter permease [Armatimonadota bacterium]